MDGDVPDAGDESDTNDDWMFKTFSKNKKLNKKKADTKTAFDPFSGVVKDIKEHIKEEANISSSSDEDHEPKCDDDSDDEMLMGGGLHLLG